MVFDPFSFEGFLVLFWENGGFVAINAHLPYIYEGRNNDYLDQFRGNLIVIVKMERILMGL